MGYELPALASGSVEARSYRTWQFVEALLENQHEVCLVVSHKQDESNVSHSLSSRLTYHRLNMRQRGWLSRLQHIHDGFKPDGINTIMFNSCLRATRLKTTAPLWMDIYGDKLAETQIAEYSAQSGRGHRNVMRYMRDVLLGGDVFSTCGTPQKHALVGQLSMVSRLNQHTFGYEFVYPVLPGAKLRSREWKEGPTLKGGMVPQDAFIVLWCGGYNVWTDAQVLFDAVNGAMEHNPRVVYVSVGAAAGGGENNSYDRFLKLIETSKYRERYHMQGWQPASQVAAYYAQADVGISLDAFHYEVLLGTRTRISEMLSYGLPVITTLGCELSEIVEKEGLGLTFPIGDASRFRDQILALAADESKRQLIAKQAQEYVAHTLSIAETTRHFLNWAGKPYHAPDRKNSSNTVEPNAVEHYMRSVARGLLWNLWALERGD